MRRLLLLVGVLALAGAAVGVGPAGAVPTSGPGAAAYIQLQTTRDALLNEESAFADPFVRSYVDQAVASLDSALTPARWTSTGLVLGYAGSLSLSDMRDAAAWLVWADAGLRDGTVSDQRNVVWSMGQIAHERFDESFHFIGEGGGASPWSLWASEYFLNLGDSELLTDVMAATLDYTSSWQNLLGQPPCC